MSANKFKYDKKYLHVSSKSSFLDILNRLNILLTFSSFLLMQLFIYTSNLFYFNLGTKEKVTSLERVLKNLLSTYF